MTATRNPIQRSPSSARTGTLMLFGNPPGLTAIRRQRTGVRSGTTMLFGNPPSARQQPRTPFAEDPTP